MFKKLLFGVILIAVGLLVWQAYDVFRTYRMLTQPQLDIVLGPADAELTIVEFFDYRCGACRAVWPVVEAAHNKYPDVRFVLRPLPMYGRFGAPSVNEARMALAAAQQQGFPAMHRLLITRENPVEDFEIPALARQAGLDPERFAADMKSDVTTDFLMETLDAAILLKIHAVPSFLVGRTLYNFTERLPTLADFDQLIASHAPSTATSNASQEPEAAVEGLADTTPAQDDPALHPQALPHDIESVSPSEASEPANPADAP